MSLNLPGGCKSREEFSDYLINKTRECVTEFKNKEETKKYLREKFNINPEDTRILMETAPNASSQQAAIAAKISSEENARKKRKTQHLQESSSQQPVSSSGVNEETEKLQNQNQ